ncbi:unnamed protein product [Owenia fusiformis]|uniref:Sialin n=1 Tax=Owenia fusiformis TaxID=6347 RepID=A0A8S4PUL4_OWEFU|nr:unnamed protein product [Owenia fusiformis]
MEEERRQVQMKEFTERSAITGEENRGFTSAIGCCIQNIPKRHILALISFLGFANIYSMRFNMSIAIVAMTHNRTTWDKNGTAIHEGPAFDWDMATQGKILSAFFFGYIFTQLPGGYLACRFGGKWLLGGGVLSTAIFTLFTPLAALASVDVLILVRVLMGLCEGMTFPAMIAIWRNWAPELERSKLTTITMSGSYIGTVLALPISSVLAKTLGWQSVFYVSGTVAIVWFVLWAFIVSDSPAEHPSITTEELEYIHQNIGFSGKQAKQQTIPWLAIFTSGPVWAIVVAHFVENWGYYTLLTEMPTFMKDALLFNLQEAGFLAAVPYLVLAFVVISAGQLADYLRRNHLSTTIVRKIFTGAAFILQAVFLVTAAYIMTPGPAVACMTLAVAIGGFSYSGFNVNPLDVAPQFASILLGISNTVATIPGIISPSLTGHIVSHGTADEWRIVFYIASGIYIVGAIVFGIFASGERQHWADMPMGYKPSSDAMGDPLTEED